MTWKLSKSELDEEILLINESLFSLGNGYLGVRGNFEEGYDAAFKSIRGTYINAYHDETEISYGEKLYAFPEKQQKIVNIIDGQTIEVYIDGERFNLFSGEVLAFERNLHMDKGFSERLIHWKSPNGKEVNLHFRRIVSFVTRELFAIDLKVEPISLIDEIKVVSTLAGDVKNFVDPNDPRVASGHAKRLEVTDIKKKENLIIIKNRTTGTKLEVACVSASVIEAASSTFHTTQTDCSIKETYTACGTVHFTKYNIFTDTFRHGDTLTEEAIAIQQQLKVKLCRFFLLQVQQAYLDEFWEKADILIDGDMALQSGIRFNIYQLLQSVGKDSYSNISAMAEVLFETARLWIDTSSILNGQFRIDDVTGPDEYTCIVNNNYYANVMAKHDLLWASKVYNLLEEREPAVLAKLVKHLDISRKEPAEWQRGRKCICLIISN
ncbi:glycoside hydrolase family 65 protein [Virgibacillus pantothenticus]|uniref:hypothetical protein n=1 Tax=Virgibacillus pantothenticus TaxID=1473 RepID=UPI002DBECCCD|nr:hypothetical protein [Virgibacillus pantothenticus]